MILPTKGVTCDCALITIGAIILSLLTSPTTVTGLWERFKTGVVKSEKACSITFDWFALALTMLFAINAIEWNASGQLERRNVLA